MLLSESKPLHWTHHVRDKMRHYKLSEARVKRVLHTPSRVEEGIAPKTIALMQRAGSKKHPYEIWVMIDEQKARRKVISAWRYPGVTKPRSGLTRNFIEDAYREYMSRHEEPG